jgi:elongator complex protein 3
MKKLNFKMNGQQLFIQFLKNKKLIGKTLAALKRSLAKTTKKKLIRNSELLVIYKKLVSQNRINVNKNFEELIRLKKIRTLSGVSPVAVLTKPYPCPGECIYCPTQKGIPKSYLCDEPAVMRATECGFDARRQVERRLSQYETTGHIPQKVELIVMGGTWSFLPRDYQIQFITDCFSACNNSKKVQKATLKALAKEQKLNETAKYRIVGLTLETRPDYINKEEVKFMRWLGCTRVELGVQSVFDEVLSRVKRGHSVAQTVKATQLLKDAGFKICYHLMPNLPDSNIKKDLELFKIVFGNQRFKPDMLKVYPCVVTKQAQLYNWYQKGDYRPYSDQELTDLLLKIKLITPEWVRINRLGRDIPIANIMAGSKVSNVRQVLQEIMKDKNLKCNCIRCREVKNVKLKIKNLKLKIENYHASGGEEYFLQYVDKDNRLYALLRLRFPSYLFTKTKHLIPVLQNSAIIREVHAFGQALAIGSHPDKVQHQGLGKQLIKKAEEITKERGIKKITVIAGIGTRIYYKRLGYKPKQSYMVKYF